MLARPAFDHRGDSLHGACDVDPAVAVAPGLGPLYGLAAAALGGALLWLAWELRRDLSRRRAAVLFHYSLAYLALLFVAAALDPVVFA